MDIYKDIFVPIKKILDGEFESKEVNIRGWVYRARASQTVAFVVLRDSTGIIQCAAKKEENEQNYEKAKAVYLETSLMINGIVKKDSEPLAVGR